MFSILVMEMFFEHEYCLNGLSVQYWGSVVRVFFFLIGEVMPEQTDRYDDITGIYVFNFSQTWHTQY